MAKGEETFGSLFEEIHRINVETIEREIKDYNVKTLNRLIEIVKEEVNRRNSKKK